MADTTERLLLQVDASVELLRRHMAEGEQPLDRFEKRAAKMAATVDASIGSMGRRFGAFADLAEDAASRAQRSFEDSFTQVQRIAAQAVKGPTITGGINLGADDIRAGAAAAQEQARAFALIGDAAERAALRAGDTTEATRLFLQATNASRIAAEQKATALLAEAGALERVEIELRQSGEAVDLFVGKHQRLAQVAADEQQLAINAAKAAASERQLAAAADVVRASLDPMYLAQKRFNQELDTAEALLAAGILKQHEYDAAVGMSRAALQAHAVAVGGSVAGSTQLVASQGAVRAAMQGASYQVQDLFTQLSMGANVFQVVAIQGGQLAGQFATIEAQSGTALARVAGFARFMVGPYGLAITGALLFLGPLVSKIADFSSETDKAIDKLKEDAKETETNRRAKERYGHSVEGVTAAISDQTAALDQSAKAERSAVERSNILAKTNYAEIVSIREKTKARLEDAIAAKEALDESAFANADPRVAALARRGRDESITGLRTALAEQTVKADAAARNVELTRIDLAAEAAKRSADPIARINKLYDDRAAAATRDARAAVKRGADVDASLTRELAGIERNRRAALKAEQDKQSAARTAGSGNRQIGRQITVDDARDIVAGIGGRVTSGQRSRSLQEQLYARYQAGTGPLAAKPGTSLHETGGAVDIAKTAGITLAKIRKAFADQGVRLTELLDEGTHFHAGFGKKGASQGTVEKRVEAARIKVLADDTAFAEDERRARRQLIDATRRTAATEQARENLLAEDIAVEADTQARKIANDLSAGKITQAQADRLNGLNEATRIQRTQNLIVERANRTIDRQFEAEQDNLQAKIAMLRIGEDLAVTDRERRVIAGQILEAEQELRRNALNNIRATSQDPAAVQKAANDIAGLPAIEAGERDQLGRRSAGAMEQYRDRLRQATDDTNAALQGVAVRGFGALEDAGASATAKAVTDLLHLKGVAGDVIGGVIADLARLAIQKAIVKAIGGSFFGFADGGSPGDLPGFADGGTPGGEIVGPGTGRSDSILAMLANGRGAIRVSNGEFIVNEQSTREYRPLIEAINARTLPRFATGGAIGGAPSLPALRSPSLPRAGAGRANDQRMLLEGDIRIKPTPEFDARMENVSLRTVAASAEPIMAGAEGRTMRRLNRPSLPGGLG
jgi:hypothetical protein